MKLWKVTFHVDYSYYSETDYFLLLPVIILYRAVPTFLTTESECGNKPLVSLWSEVKVAYHSHSISNKHIVFYYSGISYAESTKISLLSYISVVHIHSKEII